MNVFNTMIMLSMLINNFNFKLEFIKYLVFAFVNFKEH